MSDYDDAETDAALWGIDLPQNWQGQPEEQGIWAENFPAFVAFLTVSGQWRCRSSGLGGAHWIALDYTAVKAGLEMAGITTTPEMWADLRSIEGGALDELNRER